LSERQACKILSLSRSVLHYQARKTDDSEIEQELLALAARKPRWGFAKMADYLRNQKHGWNRKRIYRVYCGLKLNTCASNQRNGCPHAHHSLLPSLRRRTKVGHWTS